MTLPAYGFKAFVPIDRWLRPSPVITKFNPGHDNRILSTTGAGEQQNVSIEIFFSDEMNCDHVQNALSVTSTTETGIIPSFQDIFCENVNDTTARVSEYTGPVTNQVPAVWRISANLVNVSDGVHSIDIVNVTNEAGNAHTNAVNHFLLRIGQTDNPMVFPRTANYSTSLLYENADKSLYVSHKAAGADKFRYSTNWGSSWSEWETYTGGNTSLQTLAWSGIKSQAWSGNHVQIEYWSKKTGSSNHAQQGDLAGTNEIARRYPHVFVSTDRTAYNHSSRLLMFTSDPWLL
jgi:alpha-1,3-glucan synthase